MGLPFLTTNFDGAGRTMENSLSSLLKTNQQIVVASPEIQSSVLDSHWIQHVFFIAKLIKPTNCTELYSPVSMINNCS